MTYAGEVVTRTFQGWSFTLVFHADTGDFEIIALAECPEDVRQAYQASLNRSIATLFRQMTGQAMPDTTQEDPQP